ncbi:MAG: dihydroneopterin aldolase [Saprospiraceae bacterium]|nr:dihydroneopterin aldolase [Candidatus Opimibacter iunctus]
MAEIKLEGMAFFSHHGYYAHEQIRGGNYLVDVTMETDFDRAAMGDDLHQTVNYEIVYQVCADIMDQPVRLIETVVYRIAHELKKKFPEVAQIKVVVHKLSLELGGPVHSAQVTYIL